MCKWTHTDTNTPTHHTLPHTTYRAETLNSVGNRYKSWRFGSHNCLWATALGKQYIWLIKPKRCVLQRTLDRKWTQLCVPVWIWGLVPNLTKFRDELWGIGWAMKLYPAKSARPQQFTDGFLDRRKTSGGRLYLKDMGHWGMSWDFSCILPSSEKFVPCYLCCDAL